MPCSWVSVAQLAGGMAESAGRGYGCVAWERRCVPGQPRLPTSASAAGRRHSAVCPWCALQRPGLPGLPRPAGLLNVEDPEAVQALVQRAAAEITACLQLGGDVRRARLLLRFCVALVATNVLHAASVLAALRSLVDTALAAAEASEWC